MNVVIITVGTRSRREIAELIDEYIQRLPRHIKLSWVFIPHGVGDPTSSKQQEAEAILRKLPEQAYTIVLDEKGTELSSPQHAARVFGAMHETIVYVIGGAYGVSNTVLERAQFIWSLGTLVYPHQLVRLILAEQLYRAYTISTGHPYHHE